MGKRLTEGDMRHPKNCPDCVEKPRLTMWISEEPDMKLQAIVRKTQCKGADWDFSVGLMTNHPAMSKLADVIRGCSAHSNYHYHRWSYIHPKTDSRQSVSVLDNEGEADVACREAVGFVVAGAPQRRAEWRTRKR